MRALATVEPERRRTEALARLEGALGEDFLLVTQNVDDLHDRCGHERLLHMHGELRAARNEKWARRCRGQDRLRRADDAAAPRPGRSLRPHVVWFGEMPLYMGEIESFVQRCDVFVAIGTSGLVYPAAGFSELARHRGAHCVEINLKRTGGLFHEVIEGPAGECVPAYVDSLLAQRDS